MMLDYVFFFLYVTLGPRGSTFASNSSPSDSDPMFFLFRVFLFSSADLGISVVDLSALTISALTHLL